VSQILLKNLKNQQLSLDITLQPGPAPTGRVIRALLAPGESIDVAPVASLEEIEKHPQIQSLVSAGVISVTADSTIFPDAVSVERLAVSGNFLSAERLFIAADLSIPGSDVAILRGVVSGPGYYYARITDSCAFATVGSITIGPNPGELGLVPTTLSGDWQYMLGVTDDIGVPSGYSAKKAVHVNRVSNNGLDHVKYVHSDNKVLMRITDENAGFEGASEPRTRIMWGDGVVDPDVKLGRLSAGLLDLVGTLRATKLTGASPRTAFEVWPTGDGPDAGIGYGVLFNGQVTSGSGIFPVGRVYGIFDGAGFGTERLTLSGMNGAGAFVDLISLKNSEVTIVNLTATGLDATLDDGLYATPALRFAADLDNGIYRVSGDEFGLHSNVLHFRATNNEPFFSAENNSGVMVWGIGVLSGPKPQYVSGTTSTGLRLSHLGASGGIEFYAVSGANQEALLSEPGNTLETALSIRRNVAGVFSLDRVTLGAADSGGSGKRVLVVPN